MVNEACASTATPGDDPSDNCDAVGTSIVAGVPIPPLPAVGPSLYQPEPRPTPSVTATPEPIETATPEPTGTTTPEPTATSEPEPTATAEPTEPAPTATSTPDSNTGAGGVTPSATPTPIREAPMPPDTGSGGVAGGGAAVWLVLAGLGVAALGGGMLASRRRVR